MSAEGEDGYIGDYDSRTEMEARSSVHKNTYDPETAEAAPSMVGAIREMDNQDIIKLMEMVKTGEITQEQAIEHRDKYSKGIVSSAIPTDEKIASIDQIVTGEEILHEGYLTKAPPQKNGKVPASFASWKSRWFVIKKGSCVLPYYTDDKAANNGARPKGTIDLARCDTVDRYTGPSKHNYVLLLRSPQRNFLLAAPNETAFDKWFKVLTTAKTRMASASGAYQVDFSYGSDDEVVEIGQLRDETEGDEEPPSVAPFASSPPMDLSGAAKNPYRTDSEASQMVKDPSWFGVAPPSIGDKDSNGEPGEASSNALDGHRAPSLAQPSTAALTTKTEEVISEYCAAPEEFLWDTKAPELSTENSDHELKNWFFGIMSRAEAEATLREATSSSVCGGLFLVRQSDRGIGYAMSWIGGHKGNITHTKIARLANGRYKFESSQGPPSKATLTELIECEEFKSMLRRAHESFEKDAESAVARARSKNKSVVAPSQDVDDDDDEFYVMHTPLKLRQQMERPAAARTTEVVQIERENDKLRQELIQAQEYLADSRSAMETGQAPPPPPHPAPLANTSSVSARPRLASSASAKIKAPLSEVDIVSQVQHDLVDRLEMTYAVIESQTSLRNRLATNQNI